MDIVIYYLVDLTGFGAAVFVLGFVSIL